MGAAASLVATVGGDGPDGTLSPFPPEIIDCMLDYLQWREVLALLHLNSVFYRAIAWRLINRVSVVERAGKLEVEAKHTEPRLFLPEPTVVPKKWLPAFVEQVDIYPHGVCVTKEALHEPGRRPEPAEYEQHLGPSLQRQEWSYTTAMPVTRLTLPNFRTLRLFFGPVNGHQVVHTDMPPYEEHALPCRLMPARHPDVIVLRDPPAKGLRQLHSLIPPKYTTYLRRQVHVIGPDLVGEHGTVNGTIYLNWWKGGRALDTLESCEVVFWTRSGDNWLPIPPTLVAEWTESGLIQRWFDRMLRTLQMSFIELSGPAPEHPMMLGTPPPRKAGIPRLTIVNAGAIDPICYERPGDVTQAGKWANYGARQAAVEDAFKALWFQTLPPTLATRRQQLSKRVRFVSLDHWVGEGHWRGVFDPEEVGLGG